MYRLAILSAEKSAAEAGHSMDVFRTGWNAARHGLVPVANQYPWCSAAWFERIASSAQVKTIYRFKIDAVRVLDEFEPAKDW